MRICLAIAVACIACKGQPKQCSGPHRSHVQLKRVDEDSPVMKSLYAHVGADRTNEPTDPVAKAAGVRAEVDQWRWDDKTADGLPNGSRRFTDYYLISISRQSLETYIAGLGSAFVVPSDHQLVYEDVGRFGVETVPSFRWRSYFVKTDVLLDDSTFVSAVLTQQYERPYVVITLNDAGAAALTAVSAANRGHKIAYLVDGTVTSAPIIEEAITHGRFSILVSSDGEGNALIAALGCTP